MKIIEHLLDENVTRTTVVLYPTKPEFSDHRLNTPKLVRYSKDQQLINCILARFFPTGDYDLQFISNWRFHVQHSLVPSDALTNSQGPSNVSSRLIEYHALLSFIVDTSTGPTVLCFNFADRHEGLGKYYGYPDCCISAFKEMVQLRKPMTHDDPHFNGSGYRACAVCAVKPAEEVEREINARRIGSSFPHSSNNIQLVGHHLFKET